MRNRIALSPMCQYSADDGFANDWHLVHLGARAQGGAGLLIVEATAVVPEGRISAYDLGLWHDDHVAAFTPITEFIKSQGAVPGIQIAHAGRKASTARPWEGGKPVLPEEKGGWQPVAPSAVPFGPGYATPTEMSKDDIQRTVQAFADAASRALQAGFQVVEIHGAHGYLIHEFLSPLANRRDDEYGGSLENRMRFLTEVVTAIRGVWPDDLPLFLRISATDWMDEGGWTLDDSIALAKAMVPLGVDLIDASSGGIVPDVPIPAGPGYQVPFAAALKQRADVLTGAVGIIVDPHQAEAVLARGEADLIFMGRELLRHPHWPLHAAQALEVETVDWPVQYVRARR